jgi:hypothetical protein
MTPKPPKPKRRPRSAGAIMPLPVGVKLELQFSGTFWTGHVEFNGARFPIEFNSMAIFGMFYKDKIGRLLALMESKR